MGLLKADFYRFFLFGFAAGAVIVVGSASGNLGSDLARGVVPVAEAAAMK